MTPQHWTWDVARDGGGFITIRPADGTANGDIGAQPIATVYEDGNAALVAAAPALLELLDEIREWLCDDEAHMIADVHYDPESIIARIDELKNKAEQIP